MLLLVGLVVFGCAMWFSCVLLRGEGGEKRERERKMKRAMELQRVGKLREYGELMREIEEMEGD